MFHGLLRIFSFQLFQCNKMHCKLVLDILTPCSNKCLKYTLVETLFGPHVQRGSAAVGRIVPSLFFKYLFRAQNELK